MPLVLQPIDQTAKMELAQQLHCWARTANGMTDVAVQYGTCCVSPTGETLGRWTIPNELCATYGPLPFTANNGETIACPPTGSAEYVPYYIYDADVDPIDVDTCVPLTPLDVPTGLAAGTPTATTIPLTWTAVDNADGYTISYSADAGVTWLEMNATGTEATLTGLTPSTEYTIRIRATDSTNAFAKSDWSATITATTADAPLPVLAAPTGLASPSQTATTVDLTWTAVADAENYVMSWSPAGAGTWTDTAPVATNSGTVTGLTTGTSYDFRVRATATGFTDSPNSATLTQSTS